VARIKDEHLKSRCWCSPQQYFCYRLVSQAWNVVKSSRDAIPKALLATLPARSRLPRFVVGEDTRLGEACSRGMGGRKALH